jgi:hypothetical protein
MGGVRGVADFVGSDMMLDSAGGALDRLAAPIRRKPSGADPDSATNSRRRMALYRRRKTRRDRLRCLAALGDLCVACGFKDERALHIDHVHGCGGKDREPLGSRYFATILRRILAGSQEYQILCANCNAIKMRVNRETRSVIHEFSHDELTRPILLDLKEYCLHGHRLFGDGIRIRRDGQRDCRACMRRRNQDQRRQPAWLTKGRNMVLRFIA